MPTAIDEAAIYTVAEAAKALGMGETFVRKRIKSGELPAKRLGSSIRIKGSELAAWFDGQQMKSANTTSCRPERDGSPSGTLAIADAALASAFRHPRA